MISSLPRRVSLPHPLDALALLLAALLLVVNYLLWAPGHGSYWQVSAREYEALRLGQLNDRHALRNAALRAEVTSLRNGLDAVEDRARTSLGMIREGETLYRLIDVPAAEPRR